MSCIKQNCMRNMHCRSHVLMQQECQYETQYGNCVVSMMSYAAHCSVGGRCVRAVSGRVWQWGSVSQPPSLHHTVDHGVSVQHQLSLTLSSSHGSSLTRGTCHRSLCIMPTASSLFHETPDWDLSGSTCPPQRCIIQPCCYRHHPDNQTS